MTVTPALSNSPGASKNTPNMRTVSGSPGAEAKSGALTTMPSLISSRLIAGQPIRRLSACDSVVLPTPDGPVIRIRCGRFTAPTYKVPVEPKLILELLPVGVGRSRPRKWPLRQIVDGIRWRIIRVPREEQAARAPDRTESWPTGPTSRRPTETCYTDAASRPPSTGSQTRSATGTSRTCLAARPRRLFRHQEAVNRNHARNRAPGERAMAAALLSALAIGTANQAALAHFRWSRC